MKVNPRLPTTINSIGSTKSTKDYKNQVLEVKDSLPRHNQFGSCQTDGSDGPVEPEVRTVFLQGNKGRSGLLGQIDS